jgi:hypothetical protein
VETFHCGISVRALAIDSKENVWVASNMDLKTPQPKLPEGISIMEQFKLITAHMFKYVSGLRKEDVSLEHLAVEISVMRP